MARCFDNDPSDDLSHVNSDDSFNISRSFSADPKSDSRLAITNSSDESNKLRQTTIFNASAKDLQLMGSGNPQKNNAHYNANLKIDDATQILQKAASYDIFLDASKGQQYFNKTDLCAFPAPVNFGGCIKSKVVPTPADTWSEYPAIQDVDLAGFALTNVTELLSASTNNVLQTDYQPLITSTAPASKISMQNAVIELVSYPTGYDGAPNTFTFDATGVLTAPSLAIQSGGGGSITFADDTVQTTASVGAGNAWSTFPATQDVDIAGFKLTNVTEVNTGTANNALWIDASPLANDGIVDIFTNFQLGEANTAPASEIVLQNDTVGVFTFPDGYDGVPNTFTFDGAGVFNAPSLAIQSGAGGSITFADGTTQATAYTGGGANPNTWSAFPATQNVNMNSKSLQLVNVITGRTGLPLNIQSNVLLNDKNINGVVFLASSSGRALTLGSGIGVNIETPQNITLKTNTIDVINTLEYSSLGNLTFVEGEQNINNFLGVTSSQGFTLTQDGGGVITFADGTTQSTAGGGGGGGNFSTPSNQNLDMNSNSVQNVTNVSGSPGIGLNISSAGDSVMTLAYNATETDVLKNITEIGLANNLAYLQVVSPDRITTIGTMSYSPVAGLTLDVGSQDITNKTGTTYSNNFQLTQVNEGGTGQITFADGTTQATAPPNWSTITASQSVNMDGFSLTSVGGVRGEYLSIVAESSNNPSIIIGTESNNGASKSSEIYLLDDTVTLWTYPNGYASPVVNTFLFDGTGTFTAPKLNISGANSEIAFANELGFIKGENLTIGSLTNTSLTLQNNLNANIGDQFSQLLMNTYGFRFITGLADTTATDTYYDNTGLWTMPSIKTLGVNGVGLDMDSKIIQNVTSILGTTQQDIYMFTPQEQGLYLYTNNEANVNTVTSGLSLDTTGVKIYTEKTSTGFSLQEATLDVNGLFTVPKLNISGASYSNDITFANAYGYIKGENFTVTTMTDTKLTLQIDYSGNGGDPYGHIIIDNTGIELATGLVADDEYYAKFDSAGLFTVPSFKIQSGGGGGITFADNTIQTTAYTGGIFSNTSYVNESINNINDVLPLMQTGDVMVVSPGSFVQTTNINWNVAQTALTGSVAPMPLSILTTSNSIFSVLASQVRIANIKFELPSFLSGNSCNVDNCEFAMSLSIGLNVNDPIIINNCRFTNTPKIAVNSTFTSVCYFTNCNFLDSIFNLFQGASSQVVFNNCTGFTSFESNATYIGVNVLSNGATQMNTETIKAVTTGGSVKYESDIDMNLKAINNASNVNATATGSIKLRTNTEATVQEATFDQTGLFTVPSLKIQSGGTGAITFADNTVQTTAYTGGGGDPSTWSTFPATQAINVNLQHITNVYDLYAYQLKGLPGQFLYLQSAHMNGMIAMMNHEINGISRLNINTGRWWGAEIIGSDTNETKNTLTTTLNDYITGAEVKFIYDDQGVFTTKSLALNTGGQITFPDTTTQNTAYKNLDVQTITNTDGMLKVTAPTTHGVTIQSAMKKGIAQLMGGVAFINDTSVTANCVCTLTYATTPLATPDAFLSAIVTAGTGISIQNSLVFDTSKVFYMYYI